MSTARPREEDDLATAPSAKRAKLDEEKTAEDVEMADALGDAEADAAPEKVAESLLPPSHSLLNAPSPVYTPDGSMQRIMETDVGISEYVGHDVPQINGIIKQRYASSSRSVVVRLRFLKVHRLLGV